MPSNPMARSALRQEQAAETAERIKSEVAKAKPVLVKPFKATQEMFAPGAVLTQRWRLNLPLGVQYESILGETEAFSMFHNLAPGQRIEVLPEDMSYVAELIVLKRSGPKATLHELVKYDLPDVGASNADNVTGGYQAYAVGATWRVRRLPFKKASGETQPVLEYPNKFPSQFEAENYIRLTLIGTRA